MRRIMICAIKCYRYLISPLMGDHCRFHPSCSSYAIEAVEKHGPFKGFYLATRRLLRCHPLHDGGYDPVPENKSAATTRHTTH